MQHYVTPVCCNRGIKSTLEGEPQGFKKLKEIRSKTTLPPSYSTPNQHSNDLKNDLNQEVFNRGKNLNDELNVEPMKRGRGRPRKEGDAEEIIERRRKKDNEAKKKVNDAKKNKRDQTSDKTLYI